MTNARELSNRLAELLRREHASMAEFLLALADFDRRRLWVELGYSGLFMFLHRELGLSKGASHYRKVAAELVQRVPQVVEPLRDGRLCITSIVELAKVLTPENREEVLPRFFHRSKREAMEVTAELRPDPAPPKRDVVTKVCVAPRAPATADSERAAGQLAVVQLANLPHANSPSEARVTMSQPPDSRDLAVPLTADLRRFHINVSRRFLEKLEAARAALSHARPGATAEEILEAGLNLVLAQHAKRKGLVEKPRKVAPPAKPDHVPAHVRRAVWTRDGGRCQWPVDGGGVCGSTLRVEFDHIDPRARGGPSTVEGIRLLCAVHNQLAARRVFGDESSSSAGSAGRSNSRSPAAASSSRRRSSWTTSPGPPATGSSRCSASGSPRSPPR